MDTRSHCHFVRHLSSVNTNHKELKISSSLIIFNNQQVSSVKPWSLQTNPTDNKFWKQSLPNKETMAKLRHFALLACTMCSFQSTVAEKQKPSFPTSFSGSKLSHLPAFYAPGPGTSQPLGSLTSYANKTSSLPQVVADAENPLGELQMNIDRQKQMHRLAATYFNHRHFLFLFIPSICLTMVSGVMSFLSSAGEVDIKTDSGAAVVATTTLSLVRRFLVPNTETRAIYGTTVGVISILSIFLQSISNELDWSHRGKQHERIAVSLRNLDENLTYDILQYETLYAGHKDKASDDAIKAMIAKFQSRYEEMVSACDSPLPPQILNAFDLSQSRLRLILYPPVTICTDVSTSTSEKKGFIRAGKVKKTEFDVDWNTLMTSVNNELFNEFCTSTPLWPFYMPRGETVVKRVLKKIDRMYVERNPYKGL